jgi:hypothetical protein
MLETKRCHICGTLFIEPDGLSGCPHCNAIRRIQREKFWSSFWTYFLGALFLFVLPGAGYLYFSATPGHVVSILDPSDPGAWFVWLGMLLPGLVCLGTGYVLIKSVLAWLKGKSAELRAGSTTLLWVIIDAILFVIAAWFFGSAGIRFISQ